jgi:hypothetical protein
VLLDAFDSATKVRSQASLQQTGKQNKLNPKTII